MGDFSKQVGKKRAETQGYVKVTDTKMNKAVKRNKNLLESRNYLLLWTQAETMFDAK